MLSKIIYIDFDNTICPFGDETNPPSKDCIRLIQEWYNAGHQIVIYSCRANPYVSNLGTFDMIKYLLRYNIPYHEIAKDKPYFNVIIDDRALGVPMNGKNVDWSRISL